MRVLWLGRIVPLPLDSGDRIYSAELAGAVARAGATVDFMGLRNPDNAPTGADGLETAVTWTEVPGAPRNKVAALFSPLPHVAARFGTAAYRRALREAIVQTSYDAVVLDQYALVWALPELARLGAERPLIVHVGHDFETDLTGMIARSYRGNPAKKMALWLNHHKTRSAEVALTRASDLIVTLTEEDAEAFRRVDPHHVGLALPPGYSGRRSAERRLPGPGEPKNVVVVGSFHWIAKQLNLETFMREALPILTRAGIGLNVAGSMPDDLRARWSSSFPNACFLGFVPNLSDALDRAVFALNIDGIGGGFKLKTLDYIFNGVPVAALRGTLHGVPRSVSDHFLVAEDGPALAHRIVAAVDDRAGLRMMQEGAFAAANQLFDWNANGRRFVEALSRLRRQGAPIRL